ncbi:hypothetical protein PC9H_004513 [Pleurotus ostreatus]|uniref:Uncharacterized protein n=1 Tax=Pleurotus ostreatus TaxID=5322 RepID=A0A8H7A218_PLEOS|nr:uncharacterized protein PC9H_004513 [Pleurotus ostreatus]KAF7432572.1 hypothetical protein PC9H_004513 [Pleurotus ostreatus]
MLAAPRVFQDMVKTMRGKPKLEELGKACDNARAQMTRLLATIHGGKSASNFEEKYQVAAEDDGKAHARRKTVLAALKISGETTPKKSKKLWVSVVKKHIDNEEEWHHIAETGYHTTDRLDWVLWQLIRRHSIELRLNPRLYMYKNSESNMEVVPFNEVLGLETRPLYVLLDREKTISVGDQLYGNIFGCLQKRSQVGFMLKRPSGHLVSICHPNKLTLKARWNDGVTESEFQAKPDELGQLLRRIATDEQSKWMVTFDGSGRVADVLVGDPRFRVDPPATGDGLLDPTGPSTTGLPLPKEFDIMPSGLVHTEASVSNTSTVPTSIPEAPSIPFAKEPTLMSSSSRGSLVTVAIDITKRHIENQGASRIPGPRSSHGIAPTSPLPPQASYATQPPQPVSRFGSLYTTSHGSAVPRSSGLKEEPVVTPSTRIDIPTQALPRSDAKSPAINHDTALSSQKMETVDPGSSTVPQIITSGRQSRASESSGFSRIIPSSLQDTKRRGPNTANMQADKKDGYKGTIPTHRPMPQVRDGQEAIKRDTADPPLGKVTGVSSNPSSDPSVPPSKVSNRAETKVEMYFFRS